MALNTRLFIGNLPEDVNENALRQVFSPFGIITNVDLKIKTTAEANNSKRFAFVTLCATHNEIESCIKHFCSEDFKGSKLYVTRARESFLERLQRERHEAALKDVSKNVLQKSPKKHPVVKLDEKLNPRKRQLSNSDKSHDLNHHKIKHYEAVPAKTKPQIEIPDKTHSDKSPKKKLVENSLGPETKKKQDSDKKRLESMKMKREEFKQKKMIINTGLSGIDNVSRKKVIFSDSEDMVPIVPTNSENNANVMGHSLFDNDDDSDDNVNFSIKEHYEGKKGQKVLELQSRYKSDKRFMLDERFVDDDDGPMGDGAEAEDENVDLGQTDEKAKQLHILQDVLGIPIKSSVSRNEQTNNKKKNNFRPKLGMLRFDPLQPDHVKFLAPVDGIKLETSKKNKKKKSKEEEQLPEPPQQEGPKVEVSKDTFYKVSDALKEAIAQPNTFSLRSLFNRDDDNETKKDDEVQETDFISLTKLKEPKVRNPLDRGEVNPFKYDSSDSEAEEETSKTDEVIAKTEVKAVWNEKFFFTKSDNRLAEGIAFFTMPNDNKSQKDRRELKSLMKKRLYNRERKDQMFKKKIGGRRKSAKKSYRKKN